MGENRGTFGGEKQGWMRGGGVRSNVPLSDDEKGRNMKQRVDEREWFLKRCER